MSTRSRELVATYESTVLAKSMLDATVVEDSQGNRCFPDSTCPDKCDRGEVLSEADDLLDQVIASETCPGG